MSQAEFLAELRGHLTGHIGAEELQDILTYYEDNFADADGESEESVIATLGTPEVVAGYLHPRFSCFQA